MKKVLAFLLTAILAVTALTAVAETPSPEKSSGVIVSVSAKDTAGKNVNVSMKSTTVNQADYADALKGLGTDLKIVDQKKLEGQASVDSPLTVDFSVPGVKPTSTVYILLKKSNGEIEKIPATVSNGKVTATFTELGEFVLVTDAQTDKDITEAAKDDTKSPQTSDNATPVMVALFAVAAIVGIVSVKKIRTAA